jgi:hypothetical protein
METIDDQQVLISEENSIFVDCPVQQLLNIGLMECY